MSEIEVFLLANEVVRTDGSRLFRARVNGTDEQYVNPLATEDGMPGYAVQWIEIEGPFFDEPAGGAGYERLFDRLPLAPSDQARTGVPLEIGPGPSAGPAAGGGGPRGPGRVAAREALYEVQSAGAPGGRRAAAAVVPEPGVSPAGRRGRRAAVPGAVRRPVPEGLRLLAVDALGLHGRPGVAGLRVRRGEAGPPRRPRPGHAAGPLPVELGPRRHPAVAGRPRRAEQAGRAAGPGRADARRPQVAPLRRGVHRLLARPAEDRRHVAVHHALQRLRARRPAEAGGDWRRRGSSSPNSCAPTCRRGTSSIRTSPS